MINRIALTSVALILAFPALAQAQQREYQPGIQHKTIENKIYVDKPEPPKQPQIVRPDIKDRATAEAQTKKKEKDEELSAAERVWQKYKALATGTATADDGQKPASPPPKVEKATDANESSSIDQAAKTNQQEAAPSNIGMRSLIDAYQRNKEQQRQMKTITYETPKLDQNTAQ